MTGHALSLGGRDGRQKVRAATWTARQTPGGKGLCQQHPGQSDGGRGRGTERTRLQDRAMANRKGIFTEDALLLLPERWPADVSAAGAAPCSSPGMTTGRCLDAAHHRCTCVPKAREVSLPRCIPWHGLCQKHLPVHTGWTPGQQLGARGGSEVAQGTVTKAHTHRAPQ